MRLAPPVAVLLLTYSVVSYVVAFQYSPKCKGKKMFGAVWSLFRFDLAFIAFLFPTSMWLLPVFFDAQTSIWTRCAIRGLILGIFINVFIEMTARTSKVLVRDYQVSPFHAYFLLIKPLMTFCVAGRLMQGDERRGAKRRCAAAKKAYSSNVINSPSFATRFVRCRCIEISRGKPSLRSRRDNSRARHSRRFASGLNPNGSTQRAIQSSYRPQPEGQA